MASKTYTKNTWLDEVLASDALYNILQSDDTPIHEEVKIELDTEVGTAGTAVNAERMNNIEDGIDALDDLLVEMQSKIKLDAATELTISGGSITITQSIHKLQPESGTEDDLDTIVGVAAGDLVILYCADAGTDTITIKHGTGNISCMGEDDLELSEGGVLLYSDGTTVYAIGGGGGGGDTGGWTEDENTWAYSSVDDPTGVLTINADATSYLSVGQRIKFTNGGNTIYGIVTAISYSAPNTAVTFLHEIDPTDSQALYLMANSAISSNFYSQAKTPFGFPMDPDKWTVSVSDTTNRVQATPTQNAWYNLGSVNIVVPIGLWRLRGKVNASVQVPSATSATIYTTLSTANNSESNPEFTFYQSLGGALGTIITNVPARMEEFISLAVKTTMYLNTKTGNAGADNIANQNGNVTAGAVLKAISAYL